MFSFHSWQICPHFIFYLFYIFFNNFFLINDFIPSFYSFNSSPLPLPPRHSSIIVLFGVSFLQVNVTLNWIEQLKRKRNRGKMWIRENVFFCVKLNDVQLIERTKIKNRQGVCQSFEHVNKDSWKSLSAGYLHRWMKALQPTACWTLSVIGWIR